MIRSDKSWLIEIQKRNSPSELQEQDTSKEGSSPGREHRSKCSLAQRGGKEEAHRLQVILEQWSMMLLIYCIFSCRLSLRVRSRSKFIFIALQFRFCGVLMMASKVVCWSFSSRERFLFAYSDNLRFLRSYCTCMSTPSSEYFLSYRLEICSYSLSMVALIYRFSQMLSQQRCLITSYYRFIILCLLVKRFTCSSFSQISRSFYKSLWVRVNTSVLRSCYLCLAVSNSYSLECSISLRSLSYEFRSFTVLLRASISSRHLVCLSLYYLLFRYCSQLSLFFICSISYQCPTFDSSSASFTLAS